MATTYTPNYHLGKQEDRSDKFVMKVITDNMDVIDEQLKATDDKATAAAAGLKYKGAVNYYSDLPNDAEIGDAYTVLYAGSSGTVPDGTEYVWGELNNTAQWIDFSKDTYTKAEVDALLTAKQALLNADNKLDPAYINYDSTHRAVSDTEKSTWNSKQNAIDSSHKLSADLVDDTSTTNKFATAAELEQIETNKNNISSAQAQANINTNYGVKNILNTSFISGEVRGVTYTLNADGSVTVNGTANSYGSTMYIFDGLISAGNYVLSIGNAIGSGNYVTLIYSDNTQIGITGNDTSAQLNNKDIKKIYVYVAANTSIDLTIYPMITPKALYDADATYKSYAMDNAELTAAIQALQAQLANQ
ncbi:hypothetical protein [Ruminococcus flavefaciens]|uniref:hypothetical protein n=1 Tax=Ruminococcus flavefaciens TaxID=1265 RepID=UPI003F0073B0